MKHNEYNVRVRTWIAGEEFLNVYTIGSGHEYATLNDLYEDLCKQLQFALDHFEIIVDSN